MSPEEFARASIAAIKPSFSGSVHVPDERFVCFQGVYRRLLEVGERGVAGPEVVQGKLSPSFFSSRILANSESPSSIRTFSVISRTSAAGSPVRWRVRIISFRIAAGDAAEVVVGAAEAETVLGAGHAEGKEQMGTSISLGSVFSKVFSVARGSVPIYPATDKQEDRLLTRFIREDPG